MPSPEANQEPQGTVDEIQRYKAELLASQRENVTRLLQLPYEARILENGPVDEIIPPVLEFRDPEIPGHRIVIGVADRYGTMLSERIRPLKKTWPSQFDGYTPVNDRWFDGQSFYHAYGTRKGPGRTSMFDPGFQSDDPLRMFLFYASYHHPIWKDYYNHWSDREHRVPLAASACMFNAISPQRVELPAFAVDTDFRKLGIGEVMIPYMAYVMSQHQLGIGFHLDTNEVDAKITSSGWSPAHAWEHWGFKKYGRLETYGTGDPDEGNALYYFGNFKELVQQNAGQNPRFEAWLQEAQKLEVKRAERNKEYLNDRRFA